ncbi:hypothetical protein H8Z78_12495 [Dysosmobacter sp. NSJ-60]|nr:hypothetical protein [Dysosmobacter hominis]
MPAALIFSVLVWVLKPRSFVGFSPEAADVVIDRSNIGADREFCQARPDREEAAAGRGGGPFGRPQP